MNKKCAKCKDILELSEFHQYRTGVNKGYFHSYCIPCEAKTKKERTKILKRDPWYRTYRRILNRIYSNGHHRKYYKDKGIKNFLSVDNLKTIWFRDKAYEMKKPSIDRIDSNKNYCFDNCRYIEMSENISRMHRG